MGIIEITSLVLILAIGASIPSSSVLLVVGRSLTHGITNGICVSMGIAFGDAIFILLVIFGLSVIAESISWLFLLLKYIGAMYLIWLGLTLLLSKPIAIEVKKSAKKGDLVTSFLLGLFLTLGDVKAIFFYVSILPAFINIEKLNLTDVIVILLIDIIIVGIIKILYAFSARKFVSITKKNGFENKTKKVAGSLMLVAASYIILKP